MAKKFYWCTIKLGTFKDLDSLRKALADSEMDITTHGNVLFRQLSLSSAERINDLAKVSQMDLGFPAGTRATN
jgi:hypothetical protein